MNDEFDNQLFSERHEFKGTLSKGGISVNNLQIFIEYSLVSVGHIKGKITGDASVYKEIQKIFELPGVYCELRSVAPKPRQIEISSNKVIITSIKGKSSDMVYHIADLRFDELIIVEPHGKERRYERELIFFLSDSKMIWDVGGSIERSVSGDIKRSLSNSKIELNESFPFDIEIYPYHYYKNISLPKSYEITTDVMSLHMRTKKSKEDLSDDVFLEMGEGLCKDLLLLISFVARSRISWFRYRFQADSFLKEYVLKVSESLPVNNDVYDCAVEYHEIRKFIKVALTRFRRLRDEGFNLFWAMNHYVSTKEAKYLEQKYSTLFMALEQIKDLFAKKEGLDKILPDNEFRELKKPIIKMINDNIMDEAKSIRINEKILELNRYPLNYLLDLVFDRYKVEWRNLYPPGSERTLVSTRNNLFHSSKKVEIDHLAKEYYRLQAILERIIYGLLGWSDYSRSPGMGIKTWLAANDEKKPLVDK
ncbi:MAG: hypothetical protein WC632_03240 [Candidatus Margulisiibacteriota bacterium]